jgi:hypothetical protein
MEIMLQELQNNLRRLKETYIYYRLPEKLRLEGVDEDVAQTCSIEFSEVVDEYFRNLKYFVDMFGENGHQSFLDKFIGHLDYTSDTTCTKIDDIAIHLTNSLSNYMSDEK